MQKGEPGYAARWCLVGNIVDSHALGEEQEFRRGTKHFQPGAKVYVAPIQWGDGGEKRAVIGVPRHTKQYVEIIIPGKYITNYRLKWVCSPAVLKKMEESSFSWWNDTEKDRETITQYVKENCADDPLP